MTTMDDVLRELEHITGRLADPAVSQLEVLYYQQRCERVGKILAYHEQLLDQITFHLTIRQYCATTSSATLTNRSRDERDSPCLVITHPGSPSQTTPQ